MATKRIERTVIEGGRTGYDKNERYWSNRRLRQKFRTFLHHTRSNDEVFDREPLPMRDPGYYFSEKFKDKLSPAYAWLAKHCKGMHPEQMKGYIRGHFDTRTIPGQHIVFDHLDPHYSNYDMSWWVSGGRFDAVNGYMPNEQIKHGKPGDRIKRKKERARRNQALIKKLRLKGYDGLTEKERMEYFRFAASSEEVRKYQEYRSRHGY